MSMFRGPLSKMIDEAVEKRMTALKNTEDEVEWGDWEETGRTTDERGATTITEGRKGTKPGTKPTREVERIVKPGEPGYDEWLAAVEANPDLERKLGYVGTEGTEVSEERQRVEEPEIEKIERKEVDKIDQVDKPEEQKPSYLQTPVGQKSIMELFGVDPSKGGHLTEHAKNFFDTSYSTDNPVLDVLQDDKWMRKARKAYEKRNPSARERSRMPFERWVMQGYKPKGQDQSLHQMAKIWEGDNSGDTDNSQFLLPDGAEAMDREITGAKDVSMSRRKKSNPFDRYNEMQRKGGEGDKPPTNMRRMNTKPVSKMLQGRTMSFRKNKF